MKITEECRPCLGRLVYQAAELATENLELRAEAINKAMKLLNRDFSLEKTSIAVATPLHRVVRTVTGNPDPYFGMKQGEVTLAEQLDLRQNYFQNGDLRSDIVEAVRGNTIDFFRSIDEIKRDLKLPVEFAIDDIDKLEARLAGAKSILYLADNSGEVFFDLKLVHRLNQSASVTYVVKESPVQNDITLSDLKYFDLMKELPRVITTGTDTPGVDMDIASDEFKSEFQMADLVLAKGMGYWETLSEHLPQGKVFHLLKAKCSPVANSLGVDLDSYVALMR